MFNLASRLRFTVVLHLMSAILILLCSCEGAGQSIDSGRKIDLPDAFIGAVELEITEYSCVSVEETYATEAELTSAGEKYYINYVELLVRCGSDTCGYQVTKDEIVMVLVQPCNMDPEVIPLCDCLSDILVLLDGNISGKPVEAFYRYDNLTERNEPISLGIL